MLIWLYFHINLSWLTRDRGRGRGGRVIYLRPHCHHQNDFAYGWEVE